MIRNLTHLQSAIAEFWCHAMHPSPMWPVNGEYQCRQCFRRYRVPWEHTEPSQPEDQNRSAELSPSPAQFA
jgi:hypothetical protein